MARRVFFSFRYKHVYRVNQIRSIPNIVGSTSAGFIDESLWETVKNGESTIKRMIDNELIGTSVTVVCITYGITERKWINYEIDQSLRKGNGLLGIHLHHIEDYAHPEKRIGAVPRQIESNGFKVYKHTDHHDLAQHIEEAAKLAHR